MSFDRRIYRHPDGTEGMLYEACVSCKRDMEWKFHSPKHDLWLDSDYNSWVDMEKRVLALGYVFVRQINNPPRQVNYNDGWS
jgi:hypothetical protein